MGGADAVLQSWTSWEWKNFDRGDNFPSPSQLYDYGSGKTGHGRAWPGPIPGTMFQKSFARTYAVSIAGEALYMRFNVTSNDFVLKYNAPRIDSSIPTEIYVWPERYPGGANVTATASSGSMRVQYDGEGSQVLVHP